MDRDGRHLESLLTEDGTQTAGTPQWSPDGSKIAFTLEGSIFVMDPDGGNGMQPTTGDGTDNGPQWSPDGSSIAFMRSPFEANACRLDPGNATCEGGWLDNAIWVMHEDGSALHQITPTADGGFYGFDNPSWGTPSQPTSVEPDPPSTAKPAWQETYGCPTSGSARHQRQRPRRRSRPDSDAVGVMFDYDWTGAVYPGEAQCRIDVVGADGRIIGSAEVGLMSLMSHARTHSPMRVLIDGQAATAQGFCEPASRPTGDYRFSDIAIEGTG